MKKDFFSIEDLAQGRCAVINDGTLEELREVLGKAFPDDKKTCGLAKFYFKSPVIRNSWTYAFSRAHLPAQSVKDFLHDFRVGDLVAHHCRIGCIFTINDIDKGKAELIHYNSKHGSCITLPVDNLIPYFKKGDKAEVLENLNVFGWDSQLFAGDIIEFDKDNTFGGITFGIGDLKRLFKRIRPNSIKYDISDIELKTLNAAKKAHKESIKEINVKINNLQNGSLANEKPSNKLLDWIKSLESEIPTDRIRIRKPERHSHYNNEHGSLYKIAEQLELNAYEFDILKRIARCRKKGQFKQDLQKIKDTVDLYLKEESKS